MRRIRASQSNLSVSSSADTTYFTAYLKNGSDIDVTGDYSSFTQFKYTAEFDNTKIKRVKVIVTLSQAVTNIGFPADLYGVFPALNDPVSDGGIRFFTVINSVKTYLNQEPIINNLNYMEFSENLQSPFFITAGMRHDFFEFELIFEDGILLNENDEFGIEIKGDLTQQGGVATDMVKHRFRIHGIIPQQQ